MKKMRWFIGGLLCLGATIVIIQSTIHGVGEMVQNIQSLAALEASVTDEEEEDRSLSVIDSKEEEKTLKDGVYEGVGQGFGGEVTLKVTIKDGKIADIEVISHNETPDYFEKALVMLEEMKKNSSYKVDTISGATISSRALKTAVKDALSKAGIVISKEEQEADAKEEAKVQEKKSNQQGSGTPAEKGRVSLKTEGLKDGVYQGSANGFRGLITVQVTVEGGQLVDIDVLSYSDDSPYIDRAMGLIPDILQSGGAGVDTVSGATYSSRGLLNAVSNALNGVEEEEEDEEEEEEDVPAIVDLPKLVEGKNGFKDGTYQGSATGYRGDILLEVVVKNGKLSEIHILSAEDDEPFFSRAKDVIASLIKNNGQNTDTISGATFSSTGIINATRVALSKATTVVGNTASRPENTQSKVEVKPLPKPTPKPGTSSPSEIKDRVEKFINENELEEMLSDGTYIGYGMGYRGSIRVEIRVEDGQIAEIKVGQSKEDYEDDLAPFRGIALGITPHLMNEDGIKAIAIVSVYRQLVDEMMESNYVYKLAVKLLGEEYAQGLEGIDSSTPSTLKLNKISKAVKRYMSDTYEAQDTFDAVTGATMSASGINQGVFEAVLEAIAQGKATDENE